MIEKKSALMQDMLYLKKPTLVKSSVSIVECYVCGKGLKDGNSISAKTLANGIALFCNIHSS